MTTLRQLIDVYLLGRHRLEAVELLPLGSSLTEAIALYGVPFESEPSEESPEIMVHSFQVGHYHEAVAYEWQGIIQSITYWSAKSDPSRDLRCILERYKGDSRWSVMEQGYWYQRDDGKLRLWCSAVPAIGVAYTEFLSTKGELKQANEIKRLDELEDPTWAADHALEDVQRRFVTGEDTKLLDFARRSNRITVSSDGRHVFIVRDHYAYDINNRFMVLNGPPKPDKGYSCQVIHYLGRTEDNRSISRNIVLPKDASVESIEFEGNHCHLTIVRATTGQHFVFSGEVSDIRSLNVGRMVEQLDNEQMWAALEAEATRHRGSDRDGESAS